MTASELNQKLRCRAIGLMLILITLALYGTVTNHAFINFDDDQYVTDNPFVKSGLTWHGIVWAFTSGEAQNWHPLTWISHMLDCKLYGLNPAGHHFTNLFFHIANVLLLFLFLNRTTGAMGRSGFVAALFACHPLHVESVAWVAERKDVLSAFFWMLTLLAYANYAEKRTTGKYLLTLFLFALGLMAKPMLVTLPFVMLLLDYWPLNRVQGPPLRVKNMLAEKIPFFAFAGVSSVITFLVQKAGGAVSSLDVTPLSFRIGNAAVSYVRYISKTFWPVDLAVFYPPTHWPLWAVIFSMLFLLVLSVLAIRLARHCPYLFVGWFWFLCTLIPVIGLVQVGQQAMADRYMYIPGIGLFIAAVWSIDALFNFWRKRWIVFGFGMVALAGCAEVTEIQLNYWQNSLTLFSHARTVTTGNYIADAHLGTAFNDIGQPDLAISFLNESLQINPDYARGQSLLGSILMERGKAPEAIEHLNTSIRLKPYDAELQYNFGTALMNRSPDEAAIYFSKALQINPRFADAHCNLAVILFRQGKLPDALEHISWAVRLNPDSEAARFNYGLALLNNNQQKEAVLQFRWQLVLAPDSVKGHCYLAEALAGQSQTKEAIDEFWNALRLAPNSPLALKELAWILATDPDPKLRSGPVAVHLAERACGLTRQDATMLTTLGAAYAEAGRFPEAIETAEKARDLALAANGKEIADKNEMLLKLYHANRPYHREF